MLALGEARARAGDPAGEPTFLAAERQARDLRDAELVARAVLGRCGLGVTIVGLDAVRARALDEELELLGDGSPALRARVLARLAIELYYAHGRTRAGPLSGQAIELARGAEEPDALIVSRSTSACGMLAPSRLLVAPRDHRCHQPGSQRPDATNDTGSALLLVRASASKGASARACRARRVSARGSAIAGGPDRASPRRPTRDSRSPVRETWIGFV